MKYNSILILSLICLLLNSCQKAPQDLLVGTWEVSSNTTNTTGSTETTIENPVLYYKFEEWGEGRIISLETSTELQEMDDWFFTYVYDKAENTIVFESWVKKEKSYWIVDKLTEVSFTCHTSSDGSSTTFNGRKR